MSCAIMALIAAPMAFWAPVAGSTTPLTRRRDGTHTGGEKRRGEGKRARELLRNRKVGKATFDRATASFGQRGTLALTNLVACYATLAYVMNTYELEAPVRGAEKALPV